MVYRTTLKTRRMQAIIDDIGTSGFLLIGTAGMATTLATIPLAAVAGTVSGDTLTFSMPRSDASADASGTAAAAVITDAASGVVISGLTVGTSAGNNIVLDYVTIVAGKSVTINSATIQHAA